MQCFIVLASLVSELAESQNYPPPQSLTLFDMGGHDAPKMILTTVPKRLGGGS